MDFYECEVKGITACTCGERWRHAFAGLSTPVHPDSWVAVGQYAYAR